MGDDARVHHDADEGEGAGDVRAGREGEDSSADEDRGVSDAPRGERAGASLSVVVSEGRLESEVCHVIQRSSRSSTVRWIGAAVFERKVAVVIERSSRNARFHRWVPIAHRPGISVDRAGGPRARGMKCTSREPSIRPDETLTVSTVVSERGWCWKKLLRARTVCLAVARRWRDLSMHRARPLRRAAARNIGRVPSDVQGRASGSSRTRSARTHGWRGPPRVSRSVSARAETPRGSERFR